MVNTRNNSESTEPPLELPEPKAAVPKPAKKARGRPKKAVPAVPKPAPVEEQKEHEEEEREVIVISSDSTEEQEPESSDSLTSFSSEDFSTSYFTGTEAELPPLVVSNVLAIQPEQLATTVLLTCVVTLTLDRLLTKFGF